MKMDMRYFIAGLLCVASSCVNEKEDDDVQPDTVEVGDVLPDFSVVMNDGRTVERGSLRGRPSLILFFNTECGDCRREFPAVQGVYESYGKDGRVAFVAVSREEDAASVLDYWAANGLTLPFSAQTDRAVYNLFAYSSIPRIYVVDASLVVRAAFSDSPLATPEDLTREIERVLAEADDGREASGRP